MISYGSSLRACSIETTLGHARKIAKELGIVRVTEITPLDRLGVPVFVSIRPDAPVLCVCAGKGLTAAEGQVGAYMEAIEIAWSEVGRSALPITPMTVRDVLDTRTDPMSFVSLCPMWGQQIDLDAPIVCTPMTDVASGATSMVPSELLFFPIAHRPSFFGSSTNGLASGNTVLEATVHALTEVIERDATSLHLVFDKSHRIEPASLPPELAALAARIESRGFGVLVRWLPSEVGLPVFQSIVFDRSQPWVTLRGDGCHPSRSIALTRALTETIQARLCLIHGGRDDLTNVYTAFPNLTAEQKTKIYEDDFRALLAQPAMAFSDVPEPAISTDSLEACLDGLLAKLREAGFPRVLRAVYTPDDYPIHVVRVIVPGLECHSRDARRVGPRLRRLLKRGSAIEVAR
jgi:ribosomal protein S12 methylthiotransferase accessory factor